MIRTLMRNIIQSYNRNAKSLRRNTSTRISFQNELNKIVYLLIWQGYLIGIRNGFYVRESPDAISLNNGYFIENNAKNINF